MLKFQNNAKILIAVLIVLGLTSSNVFGDPIKIKGFNIGMTIDDALKNVERLGFEGLSIREKTYDKTDKVYYIQPGSGDRFKIETGRNDRSVILIAFSGGISNRLFNTRGIGIEIFKDIFVDEYDILDMKAFKENPGSDKIKGWEHYNLREGYRIRIYLNKEVEIIKTDKASDFAFD